MIGRERTSWPCCRATTRWQAGRTSRCRLAAEQLIAAEPRAAVRKMIDRALIAEGLSIRIPFETNDPAMVRSLAASRLGVAIAPRAMVEPADPGFVVLPVNPPRLVRDVALLWREDRP